MSVTLPEDQIESDTGNLSALAVEASLRDIFTTFLKMGLLGFGGVLPSARRVLVVERRWMSERQFAELFALCQVLPGPNVVNMSVMLGNEMGGAIGATVATSALMGGPIALLLLLASVYDHFSSVAAVQAVVGGLAAAGGGLILGTGLKMVWRLRSRPLLLAVSALSFVGAGVLILPLPVVVFALALPSIFLATRTGSPWRGR